MTNELKKLQQDHHHAILENNNIISNLTKDFNAMQTNKISNSRNDDEIENLNSQLIQCSKQNQQLNNSLEKLAVSENKF